MNPRWACRLLLALAPRGLWRGNSGDSRDSGEEEPAAQPTPVQRLLQSCEELVLGNGKRGGKTLGQNGAHWGHNGVTVPEVE